MFRNAAIVIDRHLARREYTMYKSCTKCGVSQDKYLRLMYYSRMYLGRLETEFNNPSKAAFDDFTAYREIKELRELLATTHPEQLI